MADYNHEGKHPADPSPRCSANPGWSGHCPHEERTDVMGPSMITYSHCCWCGFTSVIKFKRAQRPGHGKYGPEIWVEE